MTRFADRFRAILGPLIIVVAFVAIMVPTCQMVGCNGMMFVPNFGGGVSLSGVCPGTVVVSTTPTAIIPDGAGTLLLTLVSALVAALVVFAPKVSAVPVRVVDATPPPPPEDPLGVRFRI